MKNLRDLLENLEYQCIQGTLDKEITAVIYDSRKAEKDGLFVCVKGAVSDGHSYAAEVAQKGVSVLVVQDPVQVPEEVNGDPGRGYQICPWLVFLQPGSDIRPRS